MPMNLYIFDASPPCRAVIMTAQHLGIELNKIDVDLLTGEQLKTEYLKINPLHLVPIIEDNGFYLGESRAILSYLVDKYAPESTLYPKDPQERAIVDRMLYFDIGTIFKCHRVLLHSIIFKGHPADSESYENYHRALKIFDEILGKTTYAAGNHITIADFSLIATISFTEAEGVSLNDYSRIKAWMNKMKQQIPHYKEINDDPIQKLMEHFKSKK